MQHGGCQWLVGRRKRKKLLNRYGVLFWSDENVWELDRGVSAQIRECTKCSWTFHLRMSNFMLCEFRLNPIFKVLTHNTYHYTKEHEMQKCHPAIPGWLVLCVSLTGLGTPRQQVEHNLSVCLGGCLREREAFELVDWVKKIHPPQCRWASFIPFVEGLNRTKRQKKGKFALCLS